MFLLATLIALVLGAVGIYGFVAYLVSQRTPELGIRMAIGASRGKIRSLVLGEALAISWLGIAIGWLAAAMLAGGLESLLFQISPLDPVTFVAVPLLLVGVVILASYAPARRATRIDPVSALHGAE